jgi:NADPH-ferrihemoprotein reductase
LGLKSRVVDFDQFNKEEFPKHKLAVIVCSTHYEGDPCDNTKQFHKWIRNELKAGNKNLLSGLNYAVMGLGDTSYELYNEMGKYFDSSFEKLGGSRVYPLGAANAEHNTTEEDFFGWKTDLWTKLNEVFKSAAGSAPTEEKPKVKRVAADPLVLPYKVVAHDSANAFTSSEGLTFDMNARNYQRSFDCKVVGLRELR